VLIKRKLILILIVVLFPVLSVRGAAPNRDIFFAASISQEPAVIKYGIDVSKWQEEIEWGDVARSGIEFAMIRAGVGAYTEEIDDEVITVPISEDSQFREYIKGAQEAGIEVGVYFYSYAQTVGQIRQEAFFLTELLKDFAITYPVALDMEEDSEYYTDDPSQMAEAFLEVIVSEGYFPMLYSYKSWLEDNITSDIRGKYTVWVAHTDSRATTYRGNYYMWQYSHTARVSGIKGRVDLNIAYRDFSAFIKLNKLNNL